MINQQILKNGGAEPSAVSNLVSAWKAYQSAKEQPLNKVPHIVCTGIYNAGKSTLLNVLLDTEQFPTGDIPTTKKVAQAEFGGAVYVDTPGLNATEADDQETANAYREADVYLFVANAQNGGVGAQESEWLRELKERHADETALKRKLVYVLSQCDQLEPETVEKVRAKTSDDLQSVLGMCPDKIFCVDAHTYRDGKAQSETLLVESSGIPALRDFLKEKSREAAESLANDHAQELHLRQQVALDQLNQIESALYLKQRTECDAQDATIKEVMRLWKSFESELSHVTPSGEEIKPYYAPHLSLGYSYESGENKSFDRAWRAMKEMIREYRDKQEDVLVAAIEPIWQDIREGYCSTGIDSKYGICCNNINRVLEKWILEFQKKSISIKNPKDIDVRPKLPDDLESKLYQKLRYDVVPECSLDDCTRSSDFSNYTTYEKGFFGEHEVKMYTYTCSSAVSRLEERLNSRFERAIDYVNFRINLWGWQRFCEELFPEIEDRKNNIKKQIDNYCAQLKKDSSLSSAQEALNHIAALKKEVQS